MKYLDIDKSSDHDRPGVCPRMEDWQSRLDQFRRFEALHVGDHEWSTHEQTEPLIRELEHVFCAGAWIAVIVIAQAVIEMSLAGFNKNGMKKLELLDQYQLKEKAIWLSELRNAVVHRTATQKAAVTLDRQMNFRESLRHEAKKAVAFALQVAFLPSREPAVNAV